MSEGKKELYIPLNVVESQDVISGIAGKEIGYIGGALMAGVILAVLIFSFSGSMVLAVLIGGTIVALTVMLVRRDKFNESMLDKFRFIKIYLKAQKKYEYQYHNIYGGCIDDSE